MLDGVVRTTSMSRRTEDAPAELDSESRLLVDIALVADTWRLVVDNVDLSDVGENGFWIKKKKIYIHPK